MNDADSRVMAEMTTSRGVINIELFASHAPVTVSNFINLANRGYYDGLNFHRVIDNFMIQGGCPQGSGTGGPGYKFGDECHPDKTHDKPGMLSMANAGPSTNGSQFFITHVETPWLDGRHTVFGAILSTQDQAVVDAIRVGDSIESLKITGGDSLLDNQSERVVHWNTILDSR